MIFRSPDPKNEKGPSIKKSLLLHFANQHGFQTYLPTYRFVLTGTIIYIFLITQYLFPLEWLHFSFLCLVEINHIRLSFELRICQN
jgi:hypothetical protein